MENSDDGKELRRGVSVGESMAKHRRFRTILAASSLALAVTVAVFWHRSMRFGASQVGESLNFRRTDPRWWVVSYRGKLTLCRQEGKDWGEEFPDVQFLGVRFGGLRGPNGSLYNLAVPHWFVMLALLVAPGWVGMRELRLMKAARRAQRGLCSGCGYDLRASVGRCPECGWSIREARAGVA
jgi:hypothetical protein